MNSNLECKGFITMWETGESENRNGQDVNRYSWNIRNEMAKVRRLLERRP